MANARRVLAAGGAVLGSMLLSLPAPLLLPATGCAGDDCDADTQKWGSCSQGDAIDATHWESGTLTATPFLDFHGERTWILDPTPWMGSRTPNNVESEIAFASMPNAPGGMGFAPPAGNLSEITLVQSPNGWLVQVLNDTCAQYYLRVVVTYPELAPGESMPTTCQGDAGH